MRPLDAEVALRSARSLLHPFHRSPRRAAHGLRQSWQLPRSSSGDHTDTGLRSDCDAIEPAFTCDNPGDPGIRNQRISIAVERSPRGPTHRRCCARLSRIGLNAEDAIVATPRRHMRRRKLEGSGSRIQLPPWSLLRSRMIGCPRRSGARRPLGACYSEFEAHCIASVKEVVQTE
jgi:hypothetical protein